LDNTLFLDKNPEKSYLQTLRHLSRSIDLEALIKPPTPRQPTPPPPPPPVESDEAYKKRTFGALRFSFKK
jgi:hypothetical protein